MLSPVAAGHIDGHETSTRASQSGTPRIGCEHHRAAPGSVASSTPCAWERRTHNVGTIPISAEMKLRWALTILAATALSCVSASPPRVPAHEQRRSFEERIVLKDAAALAVIAELADHSFEQVQARMDEPQRRATSPRDLAAFWTALELRCGALVRTELTNSGDRSGELDFGLEANPWISPTSVACHFERGIITATISVEEDGTISLLRVHAPPLKAAPATCSGARSAGPFSPRDPSSRAPPDPPARLRVHRPAARHLGADLRRRRALATATASGLTGARGIDPSAAPPRRPVRARAARPPAPPAHATRARAPPRATAAP